MGLFGCGTMRTNRKHFPREELVRDKDLQAGEPDSVGDSNITVSKWKDRGKKCGHSGYHDKNNR